MLEAAATEFNFSIRSQQPDRPHPIQSYDLADTDEFFASMLVE